MKFRETKTEIWKLVPGHEGFYSISNFGRVKSLSRWVASRWGKCRNIPDRILKFDTSDKRGYLRVTLFTNKIPKKHLVHRLVLKTFVGLCPDGMECCHEDGKPTNNRLVNLRWGTHKSNCADRKLHGTELVGERAPGGVLTWTEVNKIRSMYAVGCVSQVVLSEKFDVSTDTIHKIVNYKTWKL